MFFTALLGFFGLFSSEPIYEKLSQQIQKRYEIEILQPSGITITSLGGSSKKGIKMIHMGLATQGPATIDSSRRLMIYLMSELIKRYNENLAIKPYLLDFPFTEKNLQFSISFDDSKGGFWIKDKSKPDEDQIAHIRISNGLIHYRVDDAGKLDSLRKIRTESYQDALKIIQSQNTNISHTQNNTQQPQQHE